MSAHDAKTQQLNERLQFVNFDTAQREALKNALPTISGSLDGALDTFYAKARATPETARFFANEAHIQSAKGRQVKHWEVIGSASLTRIMSMPSRRSARPMHASASSRAGTSAATR